MPIGYPSTATRFYVMLAETARAGCFSTINYDFLVGRPTIQNKRISFMRIAVRVVVKIIDKLTMKLIVEVLMRTVMHMAPFQ